MQPRLEPRADIADLLAVDNEVGYRPGRVLVHPELRVRNYCIPRLCIASFGRSVMKLAFPASAARRWPGLECLRHHITDKCTSPLHSSRHSSPFRSSRNPNFEPHRTTQFTVPAELLAAFACLQRQNRGEISPPQPYTISPTSTTTKMANYSRTAK